MVYIGGQTYDSTGMTREDAYPLYERDSEATDSDNLEANENFILGLTKSERVIRITILNAFL